MDDKFVEDPLGDTVNWDKTIELSEFNNRVEDTFLEHDLNINNVLMYNGSTDSKLDIVHEPVLLPASIKTELPEIEECRDNGEIHNNNELKKEPVEEVLADNGMEMCDYTQNDVIVHKEIVYVDCMRAEDISAVTSADLNKLNASILHGHCESCNQDYKWYCSTCPMLSYILDKSTTDRSDDRAKKTLPNFLAIKNTLLGNLGVYTLKYIPKNVKFGPFVGLEFIQTTSGYAWKLNDGKLSVTPENINCSNWMRYVNCARSSTEQNLTVVQQEGNLYFRSSCDINVGNELLVCYGNTNNTEEGGVDIQSYCYPVLELQSETVYACTYCCLGFSSEVYLRKHKAICPNTEKKVTFKGIVQCAFCKIYLDMEENTEYHMRHCCVTYTMRRSMGTNSNVPKPSIQEKVSNVLRFERSPPPNDDKYFKCFYCDYKTKTTVDDLKEHILTHKIIERSANVRRTMYVKMWTKGSNKKYKCQKCDFETNVLFNCRRHFRYIHQDATPPQKNLLSKVNEKTRKFMCTSCDYRTDSKNTLRRHARHMHDEEVPYECHDCGNSFPTKEALELHMKSAHAKKYTCPDCHYQTNYRAQLLHHMRNLHSVVDEDEMHKCDRCNFRTKYPISFRTHRLRHLGEKSSAKGTTQLGRLENNNVEVVTDDV